MGKIINIDDYRKNEVKITNKHQQVKIEREESNNFTKAKGLNNIKYAGIGTLLILGEVICSISVVHSIINFKFNSYNVVELSSAIGFFISYLGFYTYKKEILDAFINLCHKFKDHKKQISKEELEIFEEELEYVVKKEKLKEQGFIIFDDYKKKR